MNHKIRILLADDHPLFRRGVRALLELKPEYIVVGEASNGCEAIEFLKQYKVDVIFMDINMPRIDGLEATRIIKKDHPDIHIIMLTVSDYENALFEAIKSGASGYLLKNLEPSDLYLTIEKIQNGEAVINGVLATKILNEFSRISQAKPQPSDVEQLSRREIDVLTNLVKGMDNKEIAAALSISPSTVKTHLQNIIEKLHLKNRTEAAVYAIGEGIVDYRSRCDSSDQDE